MSDLELPLLRVEQLSLSFGGVAAVDAVSFDIGPGECLGLIGPNGAGKTSVINCISGAYRRDSGRILLDGRDISSLRADDIVRAGVMRTFQNVELAANRTVLRNTLIGAHFRFRASFLEGVFGVGRSLREERRIEAEARELLDEFGIGELAERLVGELSYGLRKLVEIARALLGRPRLVLLDEPVAGTSTDEKRHIREAILRVARVHDVALLLVEHDVEFVRSMADRLVVMDFGKIIAAGPPTQVLQDAAVVAAYVGETQSGRKGIAP
jgi:branched-chain amino acid transport system ATP-binding protein